MLLIVLLISQTAEMERLGDRFAIALAGCGVLQGIGDSCQSGSSSGLVRIRAYMMINPVSRANTAWINSHVCTGHGPTAGDPACRTVIHRVFYS